MKYKSFNGMDVVLLKQYELILAFYAVFLLKHPEYLEMFDFIETPNNEYMKELTNLIDVDKYSEIIKYITNFSDCTVPVNIAIGMNDEYEIDLNKFDSYCTKYIQYGTAFDFSKEIRRLAIDIDWDNFFESHKKVYDDFCNIVCNFPSNLNLNDIEEFYHLSKNHYIYSPSMFMNGGFGPSDKLGNSYYFRGFIYDENKKTFNFDSQYLVECMFHEFSHPIVNPLVLKYLNNEEILNRFCEMSKNNNLVLTYCGDNYIVMCEYLVRANAHILASKYFGLTSLENSWIVNHGFQYLPQLIDFTMDKIKNYDNYDEFVKYSVKDFMKTCLDIYEKR